jgi:hypothetical protein
LHKRFAAFVAALALALTGLTASPARADGDMTWTGKPIAAQAAAEPKPWVNPKNKFDTKAQPPIDPLNKNGVSRAMAAPAENTPVYYYAGGVDELTNVGANAGLRLWNAPWMDTSTNPPRDVHSHVEIAVIENTGTPGQRNIVEIGWGRAPYGYCQGVVAPCLWGFNWVRGVPHPNGYNGGFVDYGSTLNLGDSLAGTTESAGCVSSSSMRNQRFGIRKNDTTGDWMLWGDLCYGDAAAGEWLGHFPATLWTAGGGAAFTTANELQVFEEVTSLYAPATYGATYDGIPCADAGPGALATSGGTYPQSGQRIGDVTMPTVANSLIDMEMFTAGGGGLMTTTADMYNAVPLATEPANNVRYYNAGGPGSAGLTTGTKVVPGVVGGC